MYNEYKMAPAGETGKELKQHSSIVVV